MKPLQNGHGIIEGTPEGFLPFVLSSYAQKSWAALQSPVISVVMNDAQATDIKDALRFYAPQVQTLYMPAWDCLPYDRVSPHKDIMAARAQVFTKLANQDFKGPTVVLVTVNGVTQKFPTLNHFKDSFFDIQKGGTLDRDALAKFLIEEGYYRTETVRETGEFALRGSIIDIFPAAADDPVRIDLFDDEIETVRYFNPMSQRSLGEAPPVKLGAASELRLNDETVEQFRDQYRKTFGAIQKDDPLYEAIGEQRSYPGMEHWLPFFYEEMTDLVTELPRAPIVLDYQTPEAILERQKQVADFYITRKEALEASEGKSVGLSEYKPLPPHRLYIDQDTWNENLNPTRIKRNVTPYKTDSNDPKHDNDVKTVPSFAPQRSKSNEALYDALKTYINDQQLQSKDIIISCYTKGSRERIKGLFRGHDFDHLTDIEHFDERPDTNNKTVSFAIYPLEHGFVTHDLVVLSEQDIFGDRLSRPPKKKRQSGKDVLQSYQDIQPGDIVVHIEHGIGRFDGLENLKLPDGSTHDFLKLIYDGDDKLYVPVENIDVLSRFGSEDNEANLDKLGSVSWQKRKARVKQDLMAMADELIQTAAKRELFKAPQLSIANDMYQEFVARFPYQETEDQDNAIQAVLKDIALEKPMDRLICGDVGFGKTEVALRAAFVAAMSGTQVAIVVPTTLLARQHTQNFKQRFKGFPIKIAQLSRFVSKTEADRTKAQMKSGQVDIVIGTHALLSQSIELANLGLLVIDEEQHFGVKQKEHIKGMKENVHVLTLTATPIPRTLQLAMTGVKEMSIISTPPVDRLAVRTFILPQDPVVLKEAIEREIFRGGQVFYVCPRITDLEEVEEQIKDMIPDIKLIHAHGQMPANELDERMTAFYDGQYQLLLATNIIESGLDIPNANTLIVHRSDLFGLSQLYQIRGRVGRSKVRAYAYITYQNDKLLTETAKQRLHVMGTLDSLGAGFQLASHDLDIRGAGNLLGDKQSGHIKEIGAQLYQDMLEEAIATLKSGANIDDGEVAPQSWSPQLNLGIDVMIPEHYIPELSGRMSIYRRLSQLSEPAEIEAFAAELVDRFGPIPDSVENLLQSVRIKALCRTANVIKIDAGPKGMVIGFKDDEFKNVDALLGYIQNAPGTVNLRPDQTLLYKGAWSTTEQKLKAIDNILNDLIGLLAPQKKTA